MPTLDDTPVVALAETEAEHANKPAPPYGFEVDHLLKAAAASPRVKVQRLGVKAQAALDTLASALKRETAIAAAEAELSRLKRGED